MIYNIAQFRVNSSLLNVLLGCAGGVLVRPQSLIAAKPADSKLCSLRPSYNVSLTVPHLKSHSANDVMWCAECETPPRMLILSVGGSWGADLCPSHSLSSEGTLECVMDLCHCALPLRVFCLTS